MAGSLRVLGLWPRSQSRPAGCLKPAVPLGERAYDFPLNLEQAMALCWRVRRWKLDFEFISEAERSAPIQSVMQVVGSYIESSSFNGEFLINSGANIYEARTAHSGFAVNVPAGVETLEQEKDLICAGSNAYYLATPQLTTTNSYSSGISETFLYRLQFALSQIVDEVFQARITRIIVTSVVAPVSGFDIVPSSTGQLLGELKLLNQSFTLPFKSFDRGTQGVPPTTVGGPITSYYKTTTFRFILEPSAYWGYDPNDGNGPIFDETTGERIRFDV